MYFSARAEGRISYGHLGRTNSCYSSNSTKIRTEYRYNAFENLTALMSMLTSGVGARFRASFGTSFLYYSIKTFSMQTVTTFDMKSPCNALYQRIRQSEGLSPFPSSKSGDLSPVGCTPCSEPRTPMTIHTHTQLQLALAM